MLDPNQAPPRNFQWFFQTGTNPDERDGPQQITSITTEYPDGRTETVWIKPPADRFDPMDGSTGITWARILGADGKQHIASADILFGAIDSKDRLRNVGDLLSLATGDPAQDAAVSRFLKNLQVYPLGYWEQATRGQGISLRA